MHAAHRRRRLGIVVHHSKIWISEPVGFVFALLLVAALFSVTLVILLNESAVHRHDREIASLKAENVGISRALAEFTEKNRIAVALVSYLQGGVSSDVLLPLVNLVYASSVQFGYDPLLVFAVINVESVFDTRAQGRFSSGEYSGAMGLMQLKFETAQKVASDLGISLSRREDLFKPEVNIAIGVAYLTQEIAHFKSFKLGVLAFNQGPEAIEESMANNIPLSKSYYNKVLKNYYALKRMTEEEF